jgi:hypothetical protein
MIGYELENKESRENLDSPAEFWRNSRYSVGFGELEGSFEVFRRRKSDIRLGLDIKMVVLRCSGENKDIPPGMENKMVQERIKIFSPGMENKKVVLRCSGDSLQNGKLRERKGWKRTLFSRNEVENRKSCLETFSRNLPESLCKFRRE